MSLNDTFYIIPVSVSTGTSASTAFQIALLCVIAISILTTAAVHIYYKISTSQCTSCCGKLDISNNTLPDPLSGNGSTLASISIPNSVTGKV